MSRKGVRGTRPKPCLEVKNSYHLYPDGFFLAQPGQPAPANLFPWISLGIVVVALIYAAILTRRDRTLGDRVGSIIADRE